MKNKTSSKKYKFGTSNVGSNYIVNPATTMAENNILNAKAEQEAMQNPWIPITTLAGGLLADNMGAFASLGVKKPVAALGDSNAQGQVEVEGEEVIETPDGEIAKIKGASHEEGGVNMNLPQGTKVYSERVEKFGQSMAERKLARERKIKNLDKLIATNKDDIAIKNTYGRTMQAIEKEEQEDLKTQEMYGMMAAIQEYAYGTNEDGTPKYGSGTNKYGIEIADDDIMDGTFDFEIPFTTGKTTGKKYDKYLNDELLYQNNQEGKIIDENADVYDTNKLSKKTLNGKTKDIDGNIINKGIGHIGDIAGLAGNLVSAFGPMKNTLENRATDTPNVNSFEGFGKDALDANLKAMEYAMANKQSALQRIDSQVNGVKRSGRNGARGINQIRANDLAANEQSMSAGLSANDSFMNTMTQLFQNQSGLENQQDSAVMQGETARDLADRQDKDNFYTQKGKDIASMGEGIQQTGKDLNAIDQNKMMINIMNNLSKYGLAFDSKGNIVQKTKTT